jgi:hypothetical protein
VNCRVAVDTQSLHFASNLSLTEQNTNADAEARIHVLTSVSAVKGGRGLTSYCCTAVLLIIQAEGKVDSEQAWSPALHIRDWTVDDEGRELRVVSDPIEFLWHQMSSCDHLD